MLGPSRSSQKWQELSEVAGALRSGRSSKKWQELNQVGREKYFSLKVFRNNVGENLKKLKKIG